MPLKIADDVIELPQTQFFTVRCPHINFRGLGFKIVQQVAADEAGAADKQTAHFGCCTGVIHNIEILETRLWLAAEITFTQKVKREKAAVLKLQSNLPECIFNLLTLSPV